MTITADIQSLEPGRRIELFEVDCAAIGGDVMRFHGHLQSTSIVWQGREYKPWPIQTGGFARTSDARQPSPTLTVGDVNGTITALCIALGDLVGAKVYRRRTLAKYLDAINFPVDQMAVNQRFGIGDGATRAFQLVGPGGLSVVRDVNVTAIRRSDWQGNRILYSTARTNTIRFSDDFSQAAWSKLGSGTGAAPVVTPNAGPAPDAVGRACRVVFDRGAGTSDNDRSELSQGQSTITGQTFAQGVWLRSFDGVSTYQLQLSFHNAYPIIANVTPTWTYFEHAAPAMDTVRGFRLDLRGNKGSARADVLVSGAMQVQGEETGTYIPTGASPVSVTDYTIDEAGIVQLAAAPVKSAVLMWSGTGVAGNNPTADPNEQWPVEQWRIEQKSDEQPGAQVEFTLSSPLDFGGQQVPARQIVGMCQWRYRGPECGYTAMVFFDKNDKPVSDPALDRCSQKISGCERRYGVNNPLPHGGFLCDTLA